MTERSMECPDCSSTAAGDDGCCLDCGACLGCDDCTTDAEDGATEAVTERSMDTNYVMLAVKDHKTDPHRFEIVAQFGGETHFATKAEADAALDEYSEILETAVDRDLRARCERLERLVRRAIPAVETLGGAKAPDWLADANAEVPKP